MQSRVNDIPLCLADEAGMVTAIVIGVCCGVIVAVLLLALVVGVLVYRVKWHPGGNKSYEVPVTFENHLKLVLLTFDLCVHLVPCYY